jgi:hypothetical protein
MASTARQTVQARVPVEVQIPSRLAVSNHILTSRGQTAPLKVVVEDELGRVVPGADRLVEYKVFDRSIASVVVVGGERRVQANATGVTKITARYGALSEWFKVTVMAADEAALEGEPPYRLELKPGGMGKVDAAIRERGRMIPEVPITYRSSEPSIVTVDLNGRLTAMRVGTAQIIATAMNDSLTWEVSVHE